ncbi:F-box/kelch-repeat protein SKIP25-like [Cynara cardunculus var. scolymus]|uniref:Galactose oxidase, beta-propeller n=1 Tax=Cynara cardunculus var. scolymus TaxID=59895 RepID=A0A103Y145_CYNCS|nr:F-box/kelch-repeat protein SKIP25-like [Cynara cardunculus var. scolymus]KVI00593.1 Galactose oxidase, beta-propeller [Cynara cardunculus var. scolymus]
MICFLNQSTHSETTVDPSDEPALLPGLPNHLAQACLSTVRPSLLSAVCRQWRRLIYTPYFPPFLSLYAIVANNNGSHLSDSVGFFNFDPISSKWTTLPTPTVDPPLRFLHRHPSFISRNLTIQSLTVSSRLVLIAATGHNFLPALSHPLIFDPLTGEWFLGPPLSNPRRWCAAGSIGDAVYVASGVGAHYRGDVARMVEKWDVKRRRDEWRWEEMAALNDGRFSRESVEAVGYKGKLCMVNVKGNAGKEGVVYDVEENRWEKMAAGMLSRWKGPVGVAEEKVMYVVDEEKGAVRKYDDENDCWEEMIEGSELLKGAEQMAVGGGKLCVVSGGGRRITVVDMVAEPVKLWAVDPPLPENEVISVHILSRPSKSL